MTDQDFIKGLAEIVGADEGDLTLDTSLASLVGWDSVAYLGTMVFLEEKMGVTVSPGFLQDAKTVAELLSIARAQCKS
jgi:acyl carrier protein